MKIMRMLKLDQRLVVVVMDSLAIHQTVISTLVLKRIILLMKERKVMKRGNSITMMSLYLMVQT